MSEEFDPYREWLGLEVSRPNYFELLALSPMETDTDRVALAARTQLTKVRSIRPAGQIRSWTALIDEIKEAEQCLRNPELRRAYVAGINAADESGISPSPPVAEMIDNDVAAPPVAEDAVAFPAHDDLSEATDEQMDAVEAFREGNGVEAIECIENALSAEKSPGSY